MPTAKRAKKKVTSVAKRPAPPSVDPPGRRLSQELFALILLVLDLFLILSLVSYSPADPQTLAALGKVPAVSNWGGKVGALIAAWLMGGIGLAAFWLPIMLSWLALQCYQGTLGAISPWTGVAYLTLPLATAGLLALGWPVITWERGLLAGGGAVGRWLTGHSQPVLNLAGSLLLFTAVALASFMGITRLSYVTLLGRLGDWVSNLGRRRGQVLAPELESDLLIDRKRPSPKVAALEIDHPIRPETTPTISHAGSTDASCRSWYGRHPDRGHWRARTRRQTPEKDQTAAYQ